MAKGNVPVSITLPRNFTFHYTEGEPPKTPEHDEVAANPPSPQAYKIRRRVRPSIVTSHIHGQPEMVTNPHDAPIPTIETPVLTGSTRPALHTSTAEPADGYLAPFLPRKFMTAPRTPSGPLPVFGGDWNDFEKKNSGEAISRPMSGCSIMSDSSDDSDASSLSGLSYGGSCTSPESDAPDPFSLGTLKKGKSRIRYPLADETPSGRHNQPLKSRHVFWTADMDKHLWKTYMIYLQDPTVTPFKTLPGSPPPLGVCHRVAREAKRTWRGSKVTSNPLHETSYFSINNQINPNGRGESPDTIKPHRSGSNTPTLLKLPKQPIWPKSGASTRRRIRELCKRKATMAPHYQRLLQSRSPSPFTSSSPRSTTRSVKMSSPANEQPLQTSFETRDIKVSLATSTAASMQPDGPLARLARDELPQQQPKAESFHNSGVPWASPAPIPSDFEHDTSNQDKAAELPRLGSPFAFHTWGPSRSRPHVRPTAPRTYSNAVIGQESSQDPFIHDHGTLPYPSVHKRRAQHQLEVELSPGGTDIRKSFLEELFGESSQNPHRRVRTRGFTVGDTTVHDRLASLFTPDQPASSAETADTEMAEGGTHVRPSEAESIRRLGSPFAGISGRPTRIRGRHMPSASLSSYDPNSFASIEQLLHQDNNKAP